MSPNTETTMPDPEYATVTITGAGDYTSGTYRSPEIDHDISDPDNPSLCIWLDAEDEREDGSYRIVTPADSAPADDLRDQISDAIGSTMRLGLQDAELHDEPGAQRINEWITWIADVALAVVAPELARLRARLAEEVEVSGLLARRAEASEGEHGVTREREAEQRRRAEQAEAALTELKPAATVTAEDLRERLIETLIDSWKTASFRSFRDSAARDVDTILAALAGDPGDLPARMAWEIRNTECEHFGRDGGACSRCRATAALSVRWEAAVQQVAEVERLRAERDRLQITNRALNAAAIEALERAEQAEAEILAARNRVAGLEANGAELLERAEQAEATEKRARAFAKEMRGYCSPHGVAVLYADRLEAVMNTTTKTETR
jgi:hypothetical protein